MGDCQTGTLSLFWEITASKTDLANLYICNKAIHSRYDPMGQAQKQAKTYLCQLQKNKIKHILLIGTGLGYLPFNLMQNSPTPLQITLWDPFPQMRTSFPEKNLSFFEGIDIVTSLDALKRHFKEKKLSSKTSTRLIIHPGYESFVHYEERLAQKILSDLYDKKEKNLNDYTISKRSIDSLQRIPFIKNIQLLQGLLKGHCAIVASSAPSLDDCIDTIKKKSNGVILASAQCAHLLQKKGVFVDFIVVVDQEDYSHYLKLCNDQFHALLIESACHPHTLDFCPDKTFLFHIPSCGLDDLFWKHMQAPCMEASTATVSDCAIVLAHYMQAECLIVMGVDFCWEVSPYAQTLSNPYQDLNTPKILKKHPFELINVDKKRAKTNPCYFHAYRFLRDFVFHPQKPFSRFFHYTKGLSLHGNTSASLEEIGKELSKQADTLPLPSFCPSHQKKALQLAFSLLEKAKEMPLSNQTVDSHNNAHPDLLELPLKARLEHCQAAQKKLSHKP